MKACLFLVPLLALASPALAAGGAGGDQPAAGGGSQVQIAMTLYAAGVPLGKVDMDATVRGAEYHVVSNLQTSGIANALWKSEIQATSSGKIGPKSLQPTLYDSYNINRSGKKQQVSLSYEDGGSPRLYADPPYSTTGYEVKSDEQKSTFDPLSAVMYVVVGAGADPANPCGVTAPVFDGRRRYNIEIAKVKDTEIKMDNGLYAGKALLCQAKYRQIAGFRQKVLKPGQEIPPISAWLATFSGPSGHRYTVPLRVWADTSFGQISAVATNIKIDGQAPK